MSFPFLSKGAQIFCSDVGAPFLNQQDYDACYPTALVDAATPPTILYHAEDDPIVPTAQMLDFVASLQEQGTPYEYYEIPCGGHFLAPFAQVAAVSEGVLDASGSYASFVDRALQLDTPGCVRCDDEPTQWMINNDKDCSTSNWLINNKCSSNSHWTSQAYCRLSCFQAGRGYDGELCCAVKEPVEVCNECTDIPTPWMVANAKTCANSGSIVTKCSQDSWWVTNKYCEQSCFELGNGYAGSRCC